MFRRRWLKRLLAIVGVFTAVAALPRLAFWWFSERLRDARPTSVDTVMQEPEAWLGRLIQVEGNVDWRGAKEEWIGCSYRLVEGWKSVKVDARICQGLEQRHGRLAYVTGTLQRDGSSYVLEQAAASWNGTNFDHVRYFPPVIAHGVTEPVVIAQADEFRRRVAERAPGTSEPHAVRRLVKPFRQGCLLRFDGSVTCWHNRQWPVELVDTPSELNLVIDAAPLVSLELSYDVGVGLSATGEVYRFSAPLSDESSGEEPKGPRAAERINVPKATSLWIRGTEVCAGLENGNIACFSHTEPPREKPAQVAQLERLVSWCEVGRDEIRCPKAAPLARAGVDAFVDSEGSLYSHLCALRGGKLACSGSNWFGELGVPRHRGTSRDFEEWIPAATSEPVVEVAAGGRHTCAQLSSGWVECWGANERGQASPFSPVMSSTRPLRVAWFPLDWELSAHDDLSCMSRGGAFECWGFCKQLPPIAGLVCTTWPVAAPALRK
jgi:hypothetical protein